MRVIFACRSKAIAKPQRRELAGSSTRTIPIGERTWTDVEPGNIRSPIVQCRRNWFIFFVMEVYFEENDGAIEFWRIKDNLQKHFLYCHHWSDDKWKKSMARGRGNKKRYQYLYWFIRQGTILYLRALQGHSGRNLIDPSLQDNVSIPDGFFQYIYHVGCAINLHSIINSGLIPGGQNLSNRQYSFCLWIPWTKTIRILIRSIWINRVMHNTCIKHGRNITIRCIGSTSILLWRKDWSSIKHDRTLSFFTKHFQLVVFRKLLGWKTGEVAYDKVFASPRPPPKISLKHDWMKEFGSEDAQRPDGQVVQQSKSSQSNQPNPNPDHDDRTVKPVVCRHASHAQGARKTSFLRRSKHVYFIKKLLNMIERWHPLFAVTQVTREVTSKQCWTRWTYPDCHIPLWNKLRTLAFVNWSRRSRTTITDNFFNEIYNKTKPTIRSVRRQRKWFRTWTNVELFELFETDPKTQCKECQSYWSEGIVYCACGQLLKETVANRSFMEYTFGFLSIPEYVVEEGKTSRPQIWENSRKERISSGP